ncbi:hypothetical protein EfmAA242_03520 [Enterococcus faecium]|nr:hypothetical protein EfmAA242_03520 [Enterococcus faecium]
MKVSILIDTNKISHELVIENEIVPSTLEEVMRYGKIYEHGQNKYLPGDLSFHLSRIKGLSTNVFSPRAIKLAEKEGYGVNYFYPFLTFFLAVMLYWMTKNLIVSYIIYVWLLNLCTTLVAYHYGERFLKQKKQAFLFSCQNKKAAYRTVDIYYRSAIAEAIAITLVIPVLFYAYQIISGKEEKYPSVKLALSMSLLVYSHNNWSSFFVSWLYQRE